VGNFENEHHHDYHEHHEHHEHHEQHEHHDQHFQEDDLRAQLGDTSDETDETGAIYLKRRIFDVESETISSFDGQAHDEELQALTTQLEEAELYESNTQKQINAMTAGIEVCLRGLNDGLVEAGLNGMVKQKEEIEVSDVIEGFLKTTSGMKVSNYSGFFFVHNDSRKTPELLEEYMLNDDVLDDLKTELINMRQKVNELRIILRAAKANCVKFRSKVAIRMTMLT
jgi:hypothetical protein